MQENICFCKWSTSLNVLLAPLHSQMPQSMWHVAKFMPSSVRMVLVNRPSSRFLQASISYDEGTIFFDGQHRTFQSPQQAQREGISTIYQEINLVPYRSVAENIFLGREIFRWGLLDWRKMHSRGQ